MKIKNIWITIKKELRTIFRDKKTFIIMLVFPLIIPFFVFLYSYMYDTEEKKYDVGIDYALNEIETSIITESKLAVHQYKNLDELKNAYENNEIKGYVDYQIDNNKYTIYVDTSNTDGMYVEGYLNSYLSSYNDLLAKQYIANKGIDINEAYNQINYEVVNLQKEGQSFILTLIYSLSFTYVIMAIVMSSISMATSTTAVEKENGTLETILTFPIKSSELIIGKYLATIILGLLSSLIGFILTIGSLGIATKLFKAFASISYHMTFGALLASILIIISAALFISGLAIALTCFAKTFKEAQSKSQILTTITLIPMFISLLNIQVSKAFYLIPVANYIQILMDIFAGSINLGNVLTVLLSSLVYVILIIYFIIKQYNSEKVLFTD